MLARAKGSEDWLWAFLPGRVWRRAPALGLILSDGGWLRAVPSLGVAAPVVAFLLGLWRGGFRPADQVTYSYSLAWLCIFVVVALAGCGLGVWLWLGFVIGDLVLFDHPPLAYSSQSVSAWDRVSQFFVPHLISYLLLAVLVVGTPLVTLLARGSVTGLLSNAVPGVRAGFGAAAAGLAAGLQAALWTQAYPLLVRPLWTWRVRDFFPDAEAIIPVQQNPLLFGLVAGAAAPVWALLTSRGLKRITGRRYQPIAAEQTEAPPRMTRFASGAVLRAGLTTLLLAGLIPDYGRGVLTFIVLAGVFLTQTAVLPKLSTIRWWTTTVPLVIRLALAAGIAWVIAYLIGRTVYREVGQDLQIILAEDFSPLLYAAIAATACMALLLPAAHPVGEPPESPRPGADGGPLTGGGRQR